MKVSSFLSISVVSLVSAKGAVSSLPTAPTGYSWVFVASQTDILTVNSAVAETQIETEGDVPEVVKTVVSGYGFLFLIW